MNQLSPGDLARRLREGWTPLLLDVRQPEEHALAALPGSQLIPLGELPARAEELLDWEDQDIVVYCHHGLRSQHAIAHLAAAGFRRLHNLRGGIDRWSMEVDPSVPRY